MSRLTACAWYNRWWPFVVLSVPLLCMNLNFWLHVPVEPLLWAEGSWAAVTLTLAVCATCHARGLREGQEEREEGGKG